MPEPRRVPLPASRHDKTAYQVAKYAALEAGKIIKKRFATHNEIQVKSRRNIVTEADLMSEKRIVEILKEEYPEHGILSEEAGDNSRGKEYVWIIDPLDGTNNFHFGIPFFCVNIALAYRGKIITGVTYDPMRSEMFHAINGKGAFLNGRKTAVTRVTCLGDTSAGADLGYVPERSKEILALAAALWSKVHCIRLMGSSSLGMAYVSCGRLGLYFHKYVYPWDIATGLLLVREAGGRVINFSGGDAVTEDHDIIAGKFDLLEKFTEWMAGI